MANDFKTSVDLFCDMYEQILWSNMRYSSLMYEIGTILDKYTTTPDDVFEFVDDLYNAASPEDKGRLMQLAEAAIEALN